MEYEIGIVTLPVKQQIYKCVSRDIELINRLQAII